MGGLGKKWWDSILKRDHQKYQNLSISSVITSVNMKVNSWSIFPSVSGPSSIFWQSQPQCERLLQVSLKNEPLVHRICWWLKSRPVSLFPVSYQDPRYWLQLWFKLGPTFQLLLLRSGVFRGGDWLSDWSPEGVSFMTKHTLNLLQCLKIVWNTILFLLID